MSDLLAELLRLAARANLTSQEKIALGLAIAMLDGEAPFVIRLDRGAAVLPHKIELLDGQIALSY
jgi:hypothetical protein